MDEVADNKSKINLRDIKSSYIIKIVFSFLCEKEKLNMIINNKELQKLFLVKIEDYKKLSGRYKIGEKNGKGKEYILYSNILIFEGEYENGKRKGKGKEYYNNGKLRFKGEYLNGKRNGKGKEYYKNGKLILKEYMNMEKYGMEKDII